jgi:UDP-glucose 4-epimerase
MADLTNSRILITGGAGFVGSHIADQLLRENVGEIILLDNFVRGSKGNISEALESGKTRLIEGDIRDEDLLDNLLKGIDYCFHMAALRITQCAENPREAKDVMINGTYNLIEACRHHKVKKTILASSASIYGQASHFPTSEEHPPYNNYTFYGAAKMANELIFRSFHEMYGFQYNAMRYFNIYGPRMDTHGKYTEVLIKWYHLIKQGKRPVLFGDGEQTMDFVYIEDIAQANIIALKTNAVDEVYNVGSEVETSLKELCNTLLEVMGADIEPEYVSIPIDRKKVEVRRRLANTKKIKQIGFRITHNLKDGLKKLVAWLDKTTLKV